MDPKYLATARLLTEIAPTVFASGQFALKGGTAINLFLREMPRLSVDLDLAFTDHQLGRAEALAGINEALREARNGLSKRGFKVQALSAADMGETKLLVQRDELVVKVGVNTVTTDGHKVYVAAVEDAFGSQVDYAQLIKIYGAGDSERRYSPVECLGCVPTPVTGNPDPKHISTSYVERQNLTMRMSMRRFTRLTNGFSKKIENHAAAVALYFMWYNFGRVHQTLRVTPAMEAGVSNHVWSVEEIVGLLG